MSIGLVNKSQIQDIADAIKTKTGNDDPLTLDEMPVAIASIQGGGETVQSSLILSGTRYSNLDEFGNYLKYPTKLRIIPPLYVGMVMSQRYNGSGGDTYSYVNEVVIDNAETIEYVPRHCFYNTSGAQRFYVQGFKPKSVGYRAFYDSMIVPESLENLEYCYSDAFRQNQTSNPAPTMEANLSKLSLCYNYAFACYSRNVRGPYTFSGSTPPLLEDIPDYFGCYNQDMKYSTLAPCVKTIGNNAFSMSDVAISTIPETVTKINSCAFYCLYNHPQSDLVFVGQGEESTPIVILTMGFAGNSSNNETSSWINRVVFNRPVNFSTASASGLFRYQTRITDITFNGGIISHTGSSSYQPFYSPFMTALTTINIIANPQNIKLGTMSNSLSPYFFTGLTTPITINVSWSEGEVANAPWGATNATINYNYTGD